MQAETHRGSCEIADVQFGDRRRIPENHVHETTPNFVCHCLIPVASDDMNTTMPRKATFGLAQNGPGRHIVFWPRWLSCEKKTRLFHIGGCTVLVPHVPHHFEISPSEQVKLHQCCATRSAATDGFENLIVIGIYVVGIFFVKFLFQLLHQFSIHVTEISCAHTIRPNFAPRCLQRRRSIAMHLPNKIPKHCTSTSCGCFRQG